MACTEFPDNGLPRDPDYVAGTAGMPSTVAGSSNVGGSSAAAGGTVAGNGSATAGTGGADGGSSSSGGTGGGDGCPMDPKKVAPGKCGCGVPDEDSVDGAGCGPLQDSLVHRYSFDTNANDSVGNENGMLMNGATVADEALVLSGGADGGYLQLPAGMISAFSNATFEAWITWGGSAGGDWQRIFDFGSSDGTEGTTYLFLSARKFRSAYTSETPRSEKIADASVLLPTATLCQVAVVVNDAEDSLSLYLNGESVAVTALDLPLSAIDDNNNWLGRSQFVADDYWGGTITEFRIYDAALTGPQLKTAHEMGADTTFLKN